MAKKASDFLAKLDEQHPHMALDVELKDREETIVFRNFLRLDDKEQEEVSDALKILRVASGEDLPEGFLDELLTDEEEKQSFIRVYVERLVRGMRAAADKKGVYDEFIKAARRDYKGDFKQFIINVFEGYCEVTRLGEADTSADS